MKGVGQFGGKSKATNEGFRIFNRRTHMRPIKQHPNRCQSIGLKPIKFANQSEAPKQSVLPFLSVLGRECRAAFVKPFV